MAQQTINIGASPNDGTGTPLRTAFQYTNSNFSELYTAVGPSGNNIVVPGAATITGDLTVDTSTLKVDSANNRVGIGTASPTSKLHVFGSGTNTFLTISDVGANYNIALGTQNANIAQLAVFNTTIASGSKDFWLTALSHTFNTWDGSAYSNRFVIASDGVATWSNVGGVAGTAMTLNSTGLGVGVTPGTLGLSVNKTSGATCGLQIYQSSSEVFRLASDNSSFYVQGIANLPMRFYTNNVNNMTLDASGNLLVKKTALGTTDVGFQVESNGSVASTLSASTSATNTFICYSTGAAAYRFYVGLDGTVNATNATISAISDARFKENVQDIDVGLGAILALKPRKFDWKDGKGKDIKGDRGFIAQEFEQVFPQLVDEWADPAPEGEAPYKSVRQDLIPVLVKAIQELAAEVNALKNA